MMRILRTASGIVSRCGSDALLRAVGASAILMTTVWFASWLWGWAASAGSNDHPGPYFLAALVSLAYMIASLITMGIMSDPPSRWTLERMTEYAPFVAWRAAISDDRVTAWKLLLWPPLVPVEGLICLWLAIGWLIRLLNIDLSKR